MLDNKWVWFAGGILVAYFVVPRVLPLVYGAFGKGQ